MTSFSHVIGPLQPPFFLLQIRFRILLALSLPFPVSVPLGKHTARGGVDGERERHLLLVLLIVTSDSHEKRGREGL